MRYKILLGQPGSGTLTEGAAKAAYLASLHHDVERVPSCHSGPNFNNIWCGALNAGRLGRYSHLVMCCADMDVIEDQPGTRWLDRMVEDMDRTGADFLSATTSIKDHRSVLSSGIGNPKDRWNPWRRFTTKELKNLPEVFSAEDIGYPEKYLLHNQHLCLWDLRKPLWYAPDAKGEIPFVFNFSERILALEGGFHLEQESEDWAFSRTLWEGGAKTFVTRRVHTQHPGMITFDNQEEGSYQHGDEDNAPRWRVPGAPDWLGNKQKETTVWDAFFRGLWRRLSRS